MTPNQRSQLLSALLLFSRACCASGLDQISILQGVVHNGVRFLDCEPSQYYGYLSYQNDDPSQWTRRSLHFLVKTRHRNIVPAKSNEQSFEGKPDVYAAVKDLDGGTETGTVQLVYRDVAVNSTPQVNVWEVERLWPLRLEEQGNSSTVFNSSAAVPAFTDVHNLRPIDVAVLQDKYTSDFGMCNTVESLATCIIPATANTPWDTAQDGKIWQPPESKRGEIARALLYMDLRYRELNLQDCEPFEEGQLGYLSQLLQWHSDYPPNINEIQRNNRACTRWQGNRNPFVDYPVLAQAIHGSPQQLTERRIYESCIDEMTTSNQTEEDGISPYEEDFDSNYPSFTPTTDPSAVPTATPSMSPDSCESIGDGSLPFFIVNTRDPDEIMLLALEKIPGGIELYLSDQAWDGADFVRGELDEGVIVMTTPEEGIPAGFIFGFGPQATYHELWSREEGTFSLGLDGDNIFLYCLNRFSQIRFLSGFTNSGVGWKPPYLSFTSYGRNSSALPVTLGNSSIALPHLLNYHYAGPRDARINLLRRSIWDPEEWEGSNDMRYQISEIPDEEERSSSSAAAPSLVTPVAVLCMLLSSGRWN